MRQRATIVVTAVLLSCATPAAGHVDADAAIAYNCHEFVARPDVPYDAARGLGVPDRYTIVLDEFDEFGGFDKPPAKTVKLFITGRHCDQLVVDGETVEDALDAYIAVPVVAPDPPAPHTSGVGPASAGSPAEGALPLENYIVQWATNSRARATWLKRGAGLDSEVTVAEGLGFDYDPVPCCVLPDEPNLRITVPAAAPSPYTIEARVTEPDGAAWYAGQNQWWDTEARTLIIFAETEVFYFGQEEGGTITSTDPDSALGTAFGDRPTRPTSYDGDKGIQSDPVQFNSYPVGTWSKCVRGAAHLCSPEDHL